MKTTKESHPFVKIIFGRKNLDTAAIDKAIALLARERGESVGEAQAFVIRTGLRRLAAATRSIEKRKGGAS
jgi:hypothetical protein